MLLRSRTRGPFLPLMLNGLRRRNISELIFNFNSKWFVFIFYRYCRSGQSNNSAHGQQIRAYQFWHHEKMTLDNMCIKLSLKNERYHQQEEMNLKPGTVM